MYIQFIHALLHVYVCIYIQVIYLFRSVIYLMSSKKIYKFIYFIIMHLPPYKYIFEIK